MTFSRKLLVVIFSVFIMFFVLTTIDAAVGSSYSDTDQIEVKNNSVLALKLEENIKYYAPKSTDPFDEISDIDKNVPSNPVSGDFSDIFSSPLLNTNTFGATVPFITLEAEDADSITGSIVKLGSPFPWPSTPAQEASGRAFVELTDTGDYLEFNISTSANTMVIRHCIPDALTGGGITATLGLYVNGVRRQDVTLSSKYNWLYITNPNPYSNGPNNTPNDYPHVFWDETRLFISGGIKAGDVIRLQKDAGDTAAYYRIDLVDLEEAPAPLTQLENSLSVVDYGATGVSADTDTAAIKACIAAAKAQGKTVWIPVGKYLQNKKFDLDGVKVQGAGMWYTTLYDVVGNAATSWQGNAGFKFSGNGPGVSDLSINSSCTARTKYSPKPFTGNSSNWTIERVWITHTGVGLWMNGHHGIIRDCRVRFTYADGINVNNGGGNDTADVLVENNHVRGVGDDGIAILCEQSSLGGTSRVTVRYNTVAAVWWASNIDLAGGDNHLIHNNLLTDGSGFVVNLPPAYAMKELQNSLFSFNKILRCGNLIGGERGSIWIFPGSAEIQNLQIENNWIEDSFYYGILCDAQNTQNISFKNNKIYNSGRGAVLIKSGVVGKGVFEGNVSTNSGATPFVNNAPNTYTVVDEGNNVWE